MENDPGEMRFLVVEIDETKLRKMALNPAVQGCGDDVYFIKDNQIVGKGRAVSMRDNFDIGVEPDAETTATLFADDYTIPILGSVFGLRYSRYDGGPLPGLTDEPVDRHKGTTVVGKWYFDLGIAPEEFATVPGYGAARTQNAEATVEVR